MRGYLNTPDSYADTWIDDYLHILQQLVSSVSSTTSVEMDVPTRTSSSRGLSMMDGQKLQDPRAEKTATTLLVEENDH